MTPIEEARAGVEFIDAELRNINEAAGAEALTDEAQASFDAGLAERARLLAVVARHEQVAALATNPANTERAEFHNPNVIVRNDPFDLSDLRVGASDSEVRSRGLAAIEKVGGLTDAHRERAEHLVRSLNPSIALRLAATGSDIYRDAFAKRIADPYGRNLTTEEANAEARAASLTDNAGGYAVPFTLDPTIILTSDGSVNPFRQISRVVPVTTDTWNGVSTAGVSAAFGAEATAITEGSPTLAQPSIQVHKARAVIDYSVEIGMDWPGFQSDMLMLLQDAKDTLEATKFAVGAGNGSNEPVGIVTALTGTGSEINVSTSEALVAADLYAMEEALGPRFRPNASFVANKAIYNLIRQFDTAGGAALWERIGAGMPSQLLGYNAYEASAMDGAYNAAATANNYIAILGDFRNYVIADRVGMSVENVPHRVDGDGKLTGQRALFAWWRVGADSVNDAAFTMLDLPTTA